MAATNYSAHIVDQYRKEGLLTDQHALEAHAVALLRGAVKFSVPDYGEVLGLDGAGMRKYIEQFPLRLPYPNVCLEFTMSYQDARSAMVLSESEDGIHAYMFSILPCCNKWHLDHRFHLFRLEDGMFSGVDNFSANEVDSDEFLDRSAAILSIVVEFCAALSCRNVSTEDIEPPKFINESRKRKGKQPFYTYKVLVLDGGGNSTGAPMGGTHASPRVHLRRGHIRHLPSGPIWVNACVVGDKSRGMVVKDYAVH